MNLRKKLSKASLFVTFFTSKNRHKKTCWRLLTTSNSADCKKLLINFSLIAFAHVHVSFFELPGPGVVSD
jgi:hypothetical protein